MTFLSAHSEGIEREGERESEILPLKVASAPRETYLRGKAQYS
jgi:hypothetical protein